VINNQEDLAAWLQKQPAGVSVAFAALSHPRLIMRRICWAPGPAGLDKLGTVR
jgi:hypothetical protein